MLLIKYCEKTKTNAILMRVNRQFSGILTKVLIAYTFTSTHILISLKVTS